MKNWKNMSFWVRLHDFLLYFNGFYDYFITELVMAICIMPFFYAELINKNENDENAAKFDPELRKKIFQLKEFKSFIIPFLENYFKG